MLKALSAIAAAIPFGFGVIRAIQTGNDTRYVWVALAAMSGGVVTTALARASGRAFSIAAVIVAVFVMAAIGGVTAALLLGTRLGPGLLVVAVAFAVCYAAASAFSLLAKRYTTTVL